MISSECENRKRCFSHNLLIWVLQEFKKRNKLYNNCQTYSILVLQSYRAAFIRTLKESSEIWHFDSTYQNVREASWLLYWILLCEIKMYLIKIKQTKCINRTNYIIFFFWVLAEQTELSLKYVKKSESETDVAPSCILMLHVLDFC